MGGRKLSNNIDLLMIPYFKEEQWLDIFNSINQRTVEGNNTILFSHIAVNGSTNNDGTKVESSIVPSILKGFKKVFLGHYHQTQEVTKNIIHLPSIQQNNFGEDTNKGYTILYDDLSYEIVRSDFKVFRKVIIDADKITKEELNEAIQTYQKQSETENIRFVFEGSEDKLKSINKERFYQVGIDVQMKNRDIEIVEDFDTVEITQYDSENIVEEFEEFCETNSYNLKEGLSYLK
jgi:DNA repair protein SbcD/Mre11